MARMMKISLLMLLVLQANAALAVSSHEKVSCYLSKIDQGYPLDSIPAVGTVEFSTRKIKMPVQFFGGSPVIWEADLKVNAEGTFSGGHFWGIKVFRDANQKINRLSLTFESPANQGLPNEESVYDAEFYCSEFDGRELLSDETAKNLLKEHARKKFAIPDLVFDSLKVNPENDGCNEVRAVTSNRSICPAGDYAGAVVSIKVCDEKIVRSGFYCEDY